jgi:hypothetical protein
MLPRSGQDHLLQIIVQFVESASRHLTLCNIATNTHGVEPVFRSRQLCSHSRTSQHKSPALVPILSQINSVHTIQYYS